MFCYKYGVYKLRWGRRHSVLEVQFEFMFLIIANTSLENDLEWVLDCSESLNSDCNRVWIDQNDLEKWTFILNIYSKSIFLSNKLNHLMKNIWIFCFQMFLRSNVNSAVTWVSSKNSTCIYHLFLYSRKSSVIFHC